MVDAEPLSSLAMLERVTHGELRPGELGVVMARAGVGKTAFLVQLGIGHAWRGNNVLHIALGQTLEHVHAWYDALFDDLCEHTPGLADPAKRDEAREAVAHHRIIQTYAESSLGPERLRQLGELYGQHAGVKPRVLLVDGLRTRGGAGIGPEVEALKSSARELGCALWLTAQTHQSQATTEPLSIRDELVEVAVLLEPHDDHVSVRLLKTHAGPPVEAHLRLDCDTLRLIAGEQQHKPARMPAHAYTLLSGGAEGAEAAFGETAERWGMTEIHFSFAGRGTSRQRGVVVLNPDELAQGEVCPTYIEARLHRVFPSTENFKKMLQTIWHQVVTAGEVFVIGAIQADGTVRGGTGWAAELARRFKKPVFVYDQERRAWHAWQGGAWVQVPSPRISRTRFAGTGTRTLTLEGRAAIKQLFEDSFGPAPQQ